MKRVCGFARFGRCTEVVVHNASESGDRVVEKSMQRKDAALGGEEESAAELMRNAAYR